MSNHLDRIQELSERREIPPKLVIFLAQVMCGEDTEPPCTECQEDARLGLMAIYGWQHDASPSQPCPICGLIDDTCPYHRGVDDAIEADLAQTFRADRRGSMWGVLRTVRPYLWVAWVASVVMLWAGVLDPRHNRADDVFAYGGLGMGWTLLVALVVVELLVRLPWSRRSS